MPRNRGIGRKYKKSRLTVTEEPTPEVEEQPEEVVEEEEPELDDEVIEVIEEATSTVMDTVIEKLIDVDLEVGDQVFRLHKREVVAAAIREAMEAKFGYGKSGYHGESEVWFHAWSDALDELCEFQDELGIDCPTCGSPPAFCDCTVDCRCGLRHLRYAWRQGYRCTLRCSPASPFIGE